MAGVGPIIALAPFFAIPADILPRNVAGGAVALINSMGALGGFLGSYSVGWINGVTHDPSSSFLLMGLSLVIATALLAVRTDLGRCKPAPGPLRSSRPIAAMNPG